MGDAPALMVRKMGPATLLTPQPTFQPAKMVKPAVDRMPRYVERLCVLVHTWAGELFRPIRGTRTGPGLDRGNDRKAPPPAAEPQRPIVRAQWRVSADVEAITCSGR
jgi:hypothetical protein